MRNRSALWEQIAARGEFKVETKAIINNVEYTSIAAPIIERQTMPSALSIGNCCNASLSLSIMLDDTQSIEKGAEIIILSRIYNNSQVSEWKQFGTFYVDERDDDYEGLLSVVAYDAMYKSEEEFLSISSLATLDWPLTQSEVVSLIAQRLGVTVDARTRIGTGSDYIVSMPTGLTMRQILSYIALCNGGNWIITEDNQMYLVPLVRPPEDTYRVKSPEDDYIVSNSHDYLAWYVNPNDESADIPVVIDKLSTGEQIIISNVIASRTLQIATSTEDIEDESDTEDVVTKFKATNGDDSGVTLDAGDCPYMTQQICDDLFSKYNGLVYTPYTANKAIYDPCIEIGDTIRIGTVVASAIYNSTITLDVGFSSDLALPVKEEASSDTPFKPESAKYQDQINELHASIRATKNSLSLSVKNLEDHTDAELELKVDANTFKSVIRGEADTIYLRSGHFIVDSNNFSVDANGNVQLSGRITASSGEITGNLNLGGSLYNERDNYRVTVRGVQSNKTYGVIYVTDNTSGSPTYPFLVGGDGHLVATKATITGSIRATSFRADGSGLGQYVIVNDGINVINPSTSSSCRGFGYSDASEGFALSLWGRLLNFSDSKTINDSSSRYIEYLGQGELAFNGLNCDFQNRTYFAKSRISVFQESASPYRAILRPDENKDAYLGSSAYRWHSVYCGDGAFNGSDRKIKDHIEYLKDNEKVIDFLRALSGAIYTLKDGESKRRHMGFYAQDVAAAAQKTMGDLAVYQATVLSKNEKGEIEEGYYDPTVDDKDLSWVLNYSEFIPLLHAGLIYALDEIDKLKNNNEKE